MSDAGINLEWNDDQERVFMHCEKEILMYGIQKLQILLDLY